MECKCGVANLTAIERAEQIEISPVNSDDTSFANWGVFQYESGRATIVSLPHSTCTATVTLIWKTETGKVCSFLKMAEIVRVVAAVPCHLVKRSPGCVLISRHGARD